MARPHCVETTSRIACPKGISLRTATATPFESGGEAGTAEMEELECIELRGLVDIGLVVGVWAGARD
jgi:hypothetical protein